jgi:hypothetical protein
MSSRRRRMAEIKPKMGEGEAVCSGTGCPAVRPATDPKGLWCSLQQHRIRAFSDFCVPYYQAKVQELSRKLSRVMAMLSSPLAMHLGGTKLYEEICAELGNPLTPTQELEDDNRILQGRMELIRKIGENLIDLADRDLADGINPLAKDEDVYDE